MSTQYPANTAGVRYLPTLAGYKVKKFKPSAGYETEEKLHDETGLPYLYNGINLEANYDIEMTPLADYAAPVALTLLVFTASSAANALPYPLQQSGYSLPVLVIGKVEEAQDEAGRIALLTFKGVINSLSIAQGLIRREGAMPSMFLLSEAIRESFLHDKHVIMGREMQPFCLDHILMLEEIKSPLIMGGRLDIADAQLAIKICSTATNAEAMDAILRPNRFWQKWVNVTRSYPVRVFVPLWDDYVEDYSPKIEQFHYPDQEASKLPGHVLTAARLVERGHDPVKVRRMGIGEVTAWALAMMENNPSPLNPNPLKGIKDDWDIQTAKEIAEMERNQNGG